MNSLKETYHTKKIEPIESVFLDSPNYTARKMKSVDEMTLSKSVFFACSVCSGPLIPIALCVFCKKTSLRKCTKCTKICQFNDHQTCEILICFGNTINKNKGVNI